MTIMMIHVKHSSGEFHRENAKKQSIEYRKTLQKDDSLIGMKINQNVKLGPRESLRQKGIDVQLSMLELNGRVLQAPSLEHGGPQNFQDFHTRASSVHTLSTIF